MGYGYWETSLIVFLTHPGVILPESVWNFSSPFLSALWQMVWVGLLSLPGNSSVGGTMSILYAVFFVVYAYSWLSHRMAQGI